MFDFEKLAEKQFWKIWVWLDLDDKKKYSERFRKIIKWWGLKASPFILNITSIILLFYIFFRIYARSGFEKTAIILLLIIIITLRGISQKLK